jgi:prepilin peptidase CpaA
MTEDMQWLATISVYFMLATMLLATMIDVVKHRIPNVLVAPAIAIALVLKTQAAGFEGLLMAIGGLGVGLAMLLPLYAPRVMGAGDVKLVGVAGAFLGPHGALIAGLMTLVAGGVLGFAWTFGRIVKQRIDVFVAHILESRGGVSANLYAEGIAKSKGGLPYAPAIAIGAAVAAWEQGLMILTI